MRFVVSKRAPVLVLLLACITAVFGACTNDPVTGPTGLTPSTAVVLTNHSRTPVLLKGLPAGVQAYALIGSDDVLEQSPTFRYGGSVDGAGLLKNSDGTFTFITNHEDNFSVSRITLNASFQPIKGEYLMNSTAGRYRLCSATLATPAEHGFGPLFITAGESNQESQIHTIDPFGAPNSSALMTALGRWNSEQALPLPKTAYPGKTVLLVGDDDSGINAGQVVIYLSNTVGDLTGGKLYVMARTDNVTRERTLTLGQTTNVEFRELPDPRAMTGAALEAAGLSLNMLQLGRVEDLDYRKGGGTNGREIYFNVTGQNNTGFNAGYDRTKYGRTYRLRLSEADPLKGTLEVLLDGDDRTGPAGQFQNPDNITVGTNYVYIAEDPNGYGDEGHDARLYQYNIATKQLKVVMEMDHRRTTSDAAVYNVGATSANGSWEYGALIDVSDIVGIDDTHC